MTTRSDSGEQARRHSGLTSVIAAYQAPLLRYAARLLNNATLAQDVVQNTLVKLFRQWQPGMLPGDHLRNWLFRVVHNEAVDAIRAEERRRRHHEAHTAAIALTGAGGGEAHPAGPEAREALVLQCLGKLEQAQQQVVLLRLQQGLSYEDIATITGHSSGYVGTLLHLAVKRLAVEVRRLESGTPS